jgi:hypothetical protein
MVGIHDVKVSLSRFPGFVDRLADGMRAVLSSAFQAANRG